MHALQTVQDIEGNQRPLSEFANKVAVVVNVASQCGFTDSNYKGLQFLYDKYKDYDFTVGLSPSCVKACQTRAGPLRDHYVQVFLGQQPVPVHYRC